MKLDLASRVRRPSKKPIVLRPIQPTKAQADDLAAIYRRVIVPWEAGKDRIVSAYERTLAEMQMDSADDIKGAIDDIASAIQRLVLSLTPDLRDWAFGVERVHRGKWIRNILSAASVDLSTILTAGDVEDTLGATINWNVSLVRDVSDQTRKRIETAVFNGLTNRTPAREVAKQISEATGMARARARRIAADQGVKLGERLNRARQEQAGLTKFKWRHSGKLHPRSWHLARNGKVYSWEGSGIPADDMPGVPPYCFPSGQPVSFHGDALVLWRRQHRGDLTEVVTSEGVAVRCTPNHPVLTDSGWKAAQSIQVGDYIFEANPQSLFAPDVNIEQTQPRIGNVFSALELVFGSVPSNGLGGEFHGDALINEKIDTIDFGDKSLRDHLKAAIPQSLSDLFLEIAKVALRPGLCPGLLRSFIESCHATDAGFMRGLDLISSPLWRHLSPNQLPRLAGVSDFYSIALQQISDRGASCLQPFRERFHALTSLIGEENFAFVELLAVACRAVDGLGREAPPSAQMLGQTLPVEADLGSNVAQQHTSFHGRYCKVEMVVSRAWQGHVFNLHNRENWYLAGAVPAHNCGCTAQAYISFDDD